MPKKFRKYIMVSVAHIVNDTNCTELFTKKWFKWKFMLYIFYHNKKKCKSFFKTFAKCVLCLLANRWCLRQKRAEERGLEGECFRLPVQCMWELGQAVLTAAFQYRLGLPEPLKHPHCYRPRKIREWYGNNLCLFEQIWVCVFKWK